MKLVLLLLSTVLFLLPAAEATPQPQALDVSNLTAEQITQLRSLTASMVGKPTATVVREEATEWAKLGMSVGQAVVAASKEIGIAAADFATTPLGKVLVFLIIMWVIGWKLLALVAATMLIVLSIRFCNKMHRLYGRIVECGSAPVLFGLWTRTVPLKYKDRCDDTDYVNLGNIVAIIGSIGGFVAFIAICAKF